MEENQQITDYVVYLLDQHPDKQKEINEFEETWYMSGSMPNIDDFI